VKRVFAPLFLIFAAPTSAASVLGQWTTDYGQGIIEYSVYNDSDQKTYLTISDGSNGLDEKVEIFLAIDGEGARPNSDITFTVGSVSVRMTADDGGSIATGCHSCARNFDALWALLREGQMLRVAFDGRSADFTLRGTSKIFPEDPPVADFYR
jgi:hypothetical protein